MGFKCIFCKRDFGKEKAQLEQHILTEHQEEKFDGKVGKINLLDMIQKTLKQLGTQKEVKMADKEEKVESNNLWKHQDERTVANRKASEFWDKGGGEVIAMDEDCATISEYYAKMLATGMMGSAVAHASAGKAVNEQQALAMLQNATKNPQYMEQSERNARLKQLNKQMQILEELKNQEETINNDANK